MTIHFPASTRMNAALIGLAICIVAGGVIASFTEAKWVSASLWTFAALFINGSLASFEDAQQDGFDNPEGKGNLPIAQGMGALKFWLQSLAIRLLAIALGFHFQFQ